MKTLKIGALALSVMVATSVVAYPGQKFVEAFKLIYGLYVVALSEKIEGRGWVKTAALVGPSLMLPVTHPKTSAAVAAGLAVAAYVGYKMYTEKATAEVEEIEGTAQQVPA